MSDTDETKRPKTLSLKKTETSTVKQSFSHGRTKAVVVEKKRTLGAPAPAAAKAEKKVPATEKPAPAPVETAKPASAAARPASKGVVLRQLSDEEKARRAAALADAKVSDVEARRQADEDARRRASEEETLKVERAAAEKRKAEEDVRKAAEAEARKHAEAEAARRAPGTPATAPAGEVARRRPAQEEEEETATKKIGGKIVPVKAPAPKKAGEGERRKGKLTVTRALEGDDERVRSVAAYKRHLQRVNKAQHAQPAGPAGPRDITIPETITVSDLANRMARRAVDVIKVLMKNGMMATPADVIDADTAELVATEYGHVVKRVAESDVLEGLTGAADDAGELISRPPVVTVMGHVDHGKPRCSMPCARPTLWQAKPAALPSISAPIRCSSNPAIASPLWIRPAMPPLPPCVPAAPRSPIW